MTDWKLSKEQEERATVAFDALLAASVTGRPMCAYKGLLDGREVIVLGVKMRDHDQESDYYKPVALAMTDDLFDAIEVERADGSVRKGA